MSSGKVEYADLPLATPTVTRQCRLCRVAVGPTRLDGRDLVVWRSVRSPTFQRSYTVQPTLFLCQRLWGVWPPCTTRGVWPPCSVAISYLPLTHFGLSPTWPVEALPVLLLFAAGDYSGRGARDREGSEGQRERDKVCVCVCVCECVCVCVCVCV